MSITFPPRCASRFRLERLLTEGGFGAVHLATQIELKRLVAIKLLRREALGDDEGFARFLAEARIAASLSHPHIVRILDHDVEDGVPWIAYEYLGGRTLEGVIGDGPQPIEDAIDATAQIAAALDHAHARGVLHRDVKPANVLEDRAGHYKIADFGIAKWTGASLRTRSGLIVGTPAYLAPELLRGAGASPQSEVYALGIILFELLTGRHPFDRNIIDVLQAVTTGVPRAAASRPDVPAWLDEVVARALAPDPAERLSTMQDLLHALERRAPSLHSALTLGAGPTTAVPAERRARARHALAAAVVGAGLVAGVTVLRPAGSPAAPAASPATRAPLAGEAGIAHADLGRALEAVERGWVRRGADESLVVDQLITLSPGADLARAARMIASLSAAARPDLERLEAALGRALAGRVDSARRGEAEEGELAGAAAVLAAYRLRLDRLEQLGRIAGRLSRAGDDGLTALTTFGAEVARLTYDPVLVPAAERAVRLAASVVARAAASGRAGIAGVALPRVYALAAAFRVSKFPRDAQLALERQAERLWREAGGAAGSAGRRLARVAEGLWNLGRQDDHRLFPAQRALVEEEMATLAGEVPELAEALSEVTRLLHERDRPTPPAPGVRPNPRGSG